LAMKPHTLASIAETIAHEGGLGCEIFDKAAIQKIGMGMLLGVAAGSDEEPRFIHLSYEGGGAGGSKRTEKNGKGGGATIGLVGKGITFDSGGLNLKGYENMRTMKCDMSGAAVVLATMKVLSTLKPKGLTVHGFVAATENMPSGKATRPGDVLTSLSGTTVEVDNTDAEGRLILGDAITYAISKGATELYDFATLTGACVVALGPNTAGVFSNNERCAKEFLRAAHNAGEGAWRMPLIDDLREGLKSEVADMKNVGDRYGGAITAALFLREFVKDTPWVHVDIAGPAFVDKEGDYSQRGATGAGIRSIVELLLSR